MWAHHVCQSRYIITSWQQVSSKGSTRSTQTVWLTWVAHLVLQTAANSLSMVTSPAMPPYAARIAMQRTSRSSSSFVAEISAVSEAETLFATRKSQQHIDSSGHAEYAGYTVISWRRQRRSNCFHQMNQDADVKWISQDSCAGSDCHPSNAKCAFMQEPACAEVSRMDRVVVSHRHAGKLVHYLQASSRCSSPNSVSLGLSTHEPHQQRHVRV